MLAVDYVLYKPVIIEAVKMSGKSRKDGNEQELTLEDEAKQLKAEESGGKSSKFDSMVNKASSMSKKRRGVDPIIAVSAVVFILACCIVLGNAAYNEIVKTPEPVAEYGDTLNVDYIGCYNTYYDKEGGNFMVFDTSLKSVDENEKATKSWEYNPAFKSLEVNIGSGKMLAAFESALIGHRPGETVKVEIDAKDAYGLIPETEMSEYSEKSFVSVTSYMTKEDFESAFNTTATTGVMTFKECLPDTGDEKNKVTTPYGFAAEAFLNDNGTVTVQYFCEAGKTYKMNDMMNVKVNDVEEGVISYTYQPVDPESKTMIRIYEQNVPVYRCYDEESGGYFIKTCEEKVGEKLYFTITLLNYVKSTS